jgi:putative peptidoglycan binding protein/LysM domain-containing protein
MPNHTVKQGECLSSIAAKYGFGDWKALYDDPGNAALKKKRPNPHLLFPGDVVSIPEKKKKQATVKTGQALKLSVKVPARELKLTLHAPDGTPLKNEPYALESEEIFLVGKTDGSGKLEVSVPAKVEALVLQVGGHTWKLELGHLNPMDNSDDDSVSGAQARLRNLGYDPGPADGKLGPRTSRAICAFERAQGLEVTGKLGKKTLDKLKEVHGA